MIEPIKPWRRLEHDPIDEGKIVVIQSRPPKVKLLAIIHQRQDYWEPTY